ASRTPVRSGSATGGIPTPSRSRSRAPRPNPATWWRYGNGSAGSVERCVSPRRRTRRRSSRSRSPLPSIDTPRAAVLDKDALPAKYATVDGSPVHYLHSGPTTLPDVPPALDRGRLFLLVHAAGSNAGMWQRQFAAAAEEQSVVALDFPGHGRSSGVEGLP